MDQLTQLALEKQNPWWFNKSYDTGIPRLLYYPELQKYMAAPEILLIQGARRVGKSTVLAQLIKELQADPRSVLFINLDEPLFQTKADDPVFLSQIIDEYIAAHQKDKYYIFIDEVQMYNHWIQTVKTFHDLRQPIKFILTGSTSTLLKNKISTRLSGRYFATTIEPLSLREFAAFKGITHPTIAEKKNLVEKYLEFGAFPRVVLEQDENLKQDLLKNYFQTIFLKDIIYPNKVRNNQDVFDLLYYIISNVGKPFSFKNLAKTLSIATDTVKEYVDYAEQSHLLSSLSVYDHSVRKQLANPRKMFCIDSGLVNSLAFKFSENKGRLIENLVHGELKRKNTLYYHKGNYECDFIIKQGLKITKAVQVCQSLADDAVRKREIKGLQEAMRLHSISDATIVTEADTEIIEAELGKIYVVPLYDWLWDSVYRQLRGLHNIGRSCQSR